MDTKYNAIINPENCQMLDKNGTLQIFQTVSGVSTPTQIAEVYVVTHDTLELYQQVLDRWSAQKPFEVAWVDKGQRVIVEILTGGESDQGEAAE